MKSEYRLIINGIPAIWTRSSEAELRRLIAIYNKQDRAAGRVPAKYMIEITTVEEVTEDANI